MDSYYISSLLDGVSLVGSFLAILLTCWGMSMHSKNKRKENTKLIKRAKIIKSIGFIIFFGCIAIELIELAMFGSF